MQFTFAASQDALRATYIVLIDLGVVISRPKRVPDRNCLTGYEQERM